MTYKNYLKNKNLSDRTIRNYIQQSNAFLKYANGRDVTKTLFRNYIKQYENKHSPLSTRTVYNCVVQFLKFNKKKWVRDLENFKLPKIIEFPRRILNIEFINKVLEERYNDPKDFYQKRLVLIIKLLLTTGLRADEITNCNKTNIFENKLMIKGKGKKTRVVFLTAEVIELINSWKYKYFLVSKKGKRITTKQLRSILTEFGKQIDISLSPHMFRRTFCTELIKKGCNLKVVQKLMGHSNIAITSRYIHLSEDEMFSEYSKVF